MITVGLAANGCTDVHRSIDATYGPDDSVTIASPPRSQPPMAIFIPVGETCLAIGFGTDVTRYESDLEFVSESRDVIQDGLSYPTDCRTAIDRWLTTEPYSNPEREAVRVNLSGRLELTFIDLRDRVWTGEIQYPEAWEGGRARVVVLDHVPTVPPD